MEKGWVQDDGKEVRKRQSVQTARPLKGRCGWRQMTLVTMVFHQKLLMKADCWGIVREPREGEDSEGRGRGV